MGRYRVWPGDTFTIDDELAGRIEREEIPPVTDPPPVELQGEPWGWTKGAPFPRGYRKDGRYDSR